MTSTNDRQESTAVWYFVAAVFVLTLPNLLFPGVHLVLRVVLLVAGLSLLAVGFVYLRQEIAAKNRRTDDDPARPEE